MGLLSDLLEQVVSSGPSEVLLATEQPFTLVHSKGTESIDGLVTDREVYEALGEVLSPEQQAELAVGRRVEIDLKAGGEQWQVVAETDTDTISIRAQPALNRDGLGVDEVIVIFPTDVWVTNDVRDEIGDTDELDVEVIIEVEDLDDTAMRVHTALPLKRCGLSQVRGLGAGTGRGLGLHDPFAASVVPGSLCFVPSGQGLGDMLARTLQRSVLMIGEAATEMNVQGDLWSIEEGAVIVLAIEDPSRWLSWVLRRVEEGMRVLVETRAMSPEGARRVLLGTDATARVEAWLDALPISSAAFSNGLWSIVA